MFQVFSGTKDHDNRCPSELSVKLVIGDVLHTFTAFQHTVKKNTEDDTIDETTIAERIMIILLLSKPFICSYAGRMITEVHHGGKPKD